MFWLRNKKNNFKLRTLIGGGGGGLLCCKYQNLIILDASVETIYISTIFDWKLQNRYSPMECRSRSIFGERNAIFGDNNP